MFNFSFVRFKNFIVRKLYPHGAVRRVLRGYLRGWSFEVVPGMGLTYSLGFDHLNFRFLSGRLSPGLTVYDVGANCGQMSLFFAKRTAPGGRILAFEPAPENVARLRRNLALNGVTSVQVFEAAVAEDNCSRRFNFNPGQHTTGGLAESRAHADVSVQESDVDCLCLDDLLAKGEVPPDLIKIDVEGGGLGVIRGASKLLSQCRPKLFFEIHAASADAPELEAVRLLKHKHGYRCFDLQGRELQELKPMWGTPVWCEV
jgi:FkbM family methyltransferase